MNETEQSISVLKKILKSGLSDATQKVAPEVLIEKFLTPQPAFKKLKKSPGRPRVEDDLKAKNFTLCLAKKYLEFLDGLRVPGKSDLGRGRKIRFIIDQFIEMKRRQKDQLQIMKESLQNVEKVLKSYSGDVKKGKKLELGPRERADITKAVNHVLIIVRIQAYNPKNLFRILPKDEWAVLSFCLDWAQKKGERA